MEFYIERYKNKERLDFECEVITPMFISGADTNTVELRSASIKGALRFWWRALYGREFSSIEKMKKAEGELFGDTEQKSKIKALIYTSNPPCIDRIKPLPHKTNTNFTFPAIKPGYQFSVSLITDKDNKNTIINLFTLFSILGGLGKRSRRGFGSFIIKSKNNIINLPDYLSSLLKLQNNNNVFTFTNNNSNLNFPYLKHVSIGRAFTNYNELLLTIGSLSHKYDCDFTGYAKRRRIRTHNNETIEKSKRFASPLYISSYRIGTIYYPIISVLNVAFDPDVVDINRNENKQTDFINGLIQGGR